MYVQYVTIGIIKPCQKYYIEFIIQVINVVNGIIPVSIVNVKVDNLPQQCKMITQKNYTYSVAHKWTLDIIVHVKNINKLQSSYLIL